MEGLESLSRGELLRLIQRLLDRIAALEQENEALRSRLEGGDKGKPAPFWVKPSRGERRKQERKKRVQSFVRRRESPTDVVEHALERCPDCGRKLSGGTVHHSRQVIEIPVVPAQVIEHQVVARYCGVCQKTVLPRLDLSGEVVGQSRIGVGLMSLVCYFSVVARMPVKAIQRFLKAVHGLHLSVGEITEILHRTATRGRSEVEGLLEAVRRSAFVHGDETGWREDGVNGYLWSFSTPDIRYFHRDASRSAEVPKRLLGESYEGVVVSDFYGGYNHLLGPHQRCWVHFLRDLDALATDHPEDRRVSAWIRKVKGVYWRAKAFAGESARQRCRQRVKFEKELLRLAKPYLDRDVPQRVLAQRIERFLPELFTFVEHPQVPSENNAAERALRPAVIARKVSGGTRSKKGSETRTALMSLFGTWQLRGEEALPACRKMLTGHSHAPSPQPP